MGNANSGTVRERHKSGDSLPPSSPCGVGPHGQAFSFEKRPSVGTNSSQGQLSNPSSPSPHLHQSTANNNNNNHPKIIQLQQSHEDDEPFITHQPKPKLLKDLSSVIFISILFCFRDVALIADALGYQRL